MRNNKLLVVLALLLVGWIYWEFFMHRNQRTEIVIVSSLRPIGTGGRPGNGALFPVIFQLDDYYRLTSVEAIEVQTNNPTAPEHVLWHLASADGSDPVKIFIYGANISGMKPYLQGVKTETLAPNVQYRLDLTAGKLKGSKVFHTTVMP
jgi:hypothetical protein